MPDSNDTLATTAPIWRAALNGASGQPVQVLNGPASSVLAGSNGYVYLIKDQTGEVWWRGDTGIRNHPVTLAIIDPMILVGVAGQLFAFDLANRKLAWKTQLGSGSSAVSITGVDRILAGANSHIFKVNTGTGEITESHKIDGGANEVTVVEQGTSYFVGYVGVLFVLKVDAPNLWTLKKQRTLSSLGGRVSILPIGATSVGVGSRGYVYRIGPSGDDESPPNSLSGTGYHDVSLGGGYGPLLLAYTNGYFLGLAASNLEQEWRIQLQGEGSYPGTSWGGGESNALAVDGTVYCVSRSGKGFRTQVLTGVPKQAAMSIMGTAWGSFVIGMNGHVFATPVSLTDFKPQNQQQTHWCWAAIAASISQFYGGGDTTQCELANKAFGREDCCANGKSSKCNRTRDLNKALQLVGHFAEGKTGPVPLNVVAGQIAIGQPLAVSMVWTPPVGHGIVVTGVYSNGQVVVEDPTYGKSTVPYDVLKTNYHGNGGTWSYTHATKA